MSHSNIVKDLLHKLSKNEFLAQDGGYQTYSNKARQYRNQLNGLYGAGRDVDDRLVDEINQNIDQLIPVSFLEQYAREAQTKVDKLLAEQATLEQKIIQLEQAAASGDLNAQQTIKQLEQDLQAVKNQMTGLQAELTQKEAELSASAAKLEETKADLEHLRIKLAEVKNKTVSVREGAMSQTVQALFDKLRGVTAPSPAPSSTSALASPTVASSPLAPAPAPAAALALASPSTTASD